LQTLVSSPYYDSSSLKISLNVNPLGKKRTDRTGSVAEDDDEKAEDRHQELDGEGGGHTGEGGGGSVSRRSEE